MSCVFREVNAARRPLCPSSAPKDVFCKPRTSHTHAISRSVIRGIGSRKKSGTYTTPDAVLGWPVRSVT